MDTSSVYEICFEGQLSEQWSSWFEGLAVSRDAQGHTVLRGALDDQAALYGVLNKIYSLNLVLVSVLRLTSEPGVSLPSRPLS